MPRFFARDGDGNSTEFFDKAEEARAFCLKAIEGWREGAVDDGWPDEVEGVMWGIVIEEAREVMLAEHVEGCERGNANDGDGCDCGVPEQYDAMVDWRLTNVDNIPEAIAEAKHVVETAPLPEPK